MPVLDRAVEALHDAVGLRRTVAAADVGEVGPPGDEAQGSTTYAYDPAGNRIAAGGSSFTYDDFGNLASATAGATAVTYATNGDGLRVRASGGGSSATYMWDQAAGLPALLSDGTTGFLSADATLLAETSASSSAYPITDALGSVRALTGSSGSIGSTASYDVFGSVRSSSGSVGSLGYTGALTDSSGGYTGALSRISG